MLTGFGFERADQQAAVGALGAAGGVLLLGISLKLLDLKQIRVANLLPGVALAPLFVAWWG